MTEVVDFNGTVNHNTNILRWVTISEADNDFFTIYHSTDGTNFEAIAYPNGAGNSDEVNTYEFVHTDLEAGTHFYYLEQTSFDGQANKVAENISLAIDNYKFEFVSVMPANGNVLTVGIASHEEMDTQATIYDMSGRIVATYPITLAAGTNTVQFDVNQLPLGIYILGVENGKEMITTKVAK